MSTDGSDARDQSGEVNIQTDQLRRLNLERENEEETIYRRLDHNPRTGEGASTIPSHTYESVSTEESCKRCTLVRDKYYDKMVHLMCHVNRTDFDKGPAYKLMKKKIKNVLLKEASALANSEGGHILIHVEGQNKEDRHLEFIDEFMTAGLKSLIPDGSRYTDQYKRLWLSDRHEYETFTDFILLEVQKTKGFVTVDFNSKIRHDHEIVDPTAIQITSILMNKDMKSSSPQLQFLNLVPQLAQSAPSDSSALIKSEDRNLETKSIFGYLQKKKYYNAEELADYIWHDLKLKDSISSMSKVQGGGSFILGVGEEKVTGDYESKILKIHGIPDKVEIAPLVEALNKKIENNVIVLQDGSFETETKNLIMIEEHQTDFGKVLEVAIGFCNGIVFTDREGPRTYCLKGKNVVRVQKENWYCNMLEKC